MDATTRVLVASDVYDTRIQRFNDSGDELLELVEYPEQPIALTGPCWCECGKTDGDCHAGEVDCGCGCGKPFGECGTVAGVSTTA